jgi:hypothetical protein
MLRWPVQELRGAPPNVGSHMGVPQGDVHRHVTHEFLDGFQRLLSLSEHPSRRAWTHVTESPENAGRFTTHHGGCCGSAL